MIVNRTDEYKKRLEESLLYYKMVRKIMYSNLTQPNDCVSCKNTPEYFDPITLCIRCYLVLHTPKTCKHNDFLFLYYRYKNCKSLTEYKAIVDYTLNVNCQMHKNLLKIALLRMKKEISDFYLRSKLMVYSEQNEKILLVYKQKLKTNDFNDLKVYINEIETLQLEIEKIISSMTEATA